MTTNVPPTPDPPAVERRGSAAQTSSALRSGIYLGGLFILVMAAALFVANHFPRSEHYALERNLVCYALFAFLMLVPVIRYLTRPMQMFISAMIGWSIFVVAYNIAGMFYQNLFQNLRTPFEALIEGAVVYGVAAVGAWVASMCLQARHVPIARRRRRTDHLHIQP